MLEPRLVSRAEAANYCGVCTQVFDRLRKQKVMPDYVPGVRRFDLRAIDRALDQLSGLDRVATESKGEQALAEFKRQRDARRAAQANQGR